MSFQNILGQTQALEVLYKTIQSGNQPHAYLFYGPSGVGKKKSALELAKSLNCDLKGPFDNCDSCLSCHKIDQDIHPDYFLVKPSKISSSAKEALIRIEEIRKLQRKLNFLPYEGKTKVVIIDEAEKMNSQAANSFLKTLEEPPRFTLIILITSNTYQLLPTITSRCQGVKFNPLPLETLIQILSKSENIPSEEVELRAWRAGGTLDHAFSDSFAESLQFRETILELLKNTTFNRIDALFQWSKTWSKKPEKLQDILEELMCILRDLSVINSHCDSKVVINQDLLPSLRKLAVAKNLSALTKMFQTVVQTLYALKCHQNVRLSLDMMLIQFCEAI